jgi:hypothetical protein
MPNTFVCSVQFFCNNPVLKFPNNNMNDNRCHKTKMEIAWTTMKGQALPETEAPY